MISTKCGESDTTSGLGSNPTIGRFAERFTAAGGTFFFGETSELTGGEHVVAERIVDAAHLEKFQRIFDEYERSIIEQEADLLGSQPTEGNIAGGLSTIEERQWGFTLFVAGGAALHLFTTGQGNIIGNPIVPVIKLTANPRTAQNMTEHIDLDISRVITDDMSLDEAADATEDLVVETASGRWTAARCSVTRNSS